MIRHRLVSALLLGICTPATQAFDAAPLDARLDRLFAAWTSATPGCVVGVAEAGKPAVVRAYGMADLEHDIPNRADTIFEAGSVSKQFTAFAVNLLARDGKLALDDQVRTYIPELPDYGAPLTIRHMLNHTSGLRDWGSIAQLAGWPRGSRDYTQAHMLDIVTHQQALNFTPGTRWSYTNSGYNLAKTIVERVSGMSFSQFTRERIFVPLGMNDSSWRDDHTRIVKRRAMAYDHEADGYHTNMPFESVVGNGGMLTTVGDLLKWNANFDKPVVGDARMLAEAQKPGAFSDGRMHAYGMGLTATAYRGVPVVQHGGATAGYRSYLSRYPAHQVSVALLCNSSNVDVGKVNADLADIVLEPRLQAIAADQPSFALSAGDAGRMAGLYRDAAGNAMLVARKEQSMTVNGRALRVASATRLERGDGRVLEFDAIGGLRALDQYGSVMLWTKVAPAAPSEQQLRELVGVYTSAEADATLTFAVDKGVLTVRSSAAPATALKPVYRDGFRGDMGMVLFRRDAQGKVTGLSTVDDRAWDVRFTRRMQTHSIHQ